MATLTLYLSNATDTLIREDIDVWIDKYAKKYKLEPALVHAICLQESQKKFAAIRVEPHLKTKGWYLQEIPKYYRKDPYAYCSMGVMQVLFGVARHNGYRGRPFDLIRPKNSIRFGCKILSNLIDKHYYLDKVVSSYNQGSPRMKYVTVRGKRKKVFRNQDYVDSVMEFYKKLGGKY